MKRRRTAQVRFVEHVEAAASLPAGAEERFKGYGVMGQPFRSGDVVAMRRFPASSRCAPESTEDRRELGTSAIDNELKGAST